MIPVLPDYASIPIEFRAAKRIDVNDSLVLAGYELMQQYQSLHDEMCDAP